MNLGKTTWTCTMSNANRHEQLQTAMSNCKSAKAFRADPCCVPDRKRAFLSHESRQPSYSYSVKQDNTPISNSKIKSQDKISR